MLRKFSCKTLVLAVCLVCMGVLTSCIDDTFGKWLGLGDGIKIAYTIDGMTDENGNKAPASRGFTDDDGNEMLQSVHIIFFDAATEKYVTFAEVTPSAETNDVTFSKPNEIEPNKPYKTLIVGNGNKFVPDNYNGDFGRYIASFANDPAMATYKYMRKALFLRGKPTKNVYPLAGEWTDGAGRASNFILSTNTEGDEVINGHIRFRRGVAKLNFFNDCENLAVEKILVCNTRMQTPIFADSIAENATTHYQITPFSTLTDADWVAVDDQQQLHDRLYVFPNNNLRPEMGDEVTTCLIIKGTYTDEDGNVSDGYWRFNISNSLKTQALQANHEYNIHLNKVSKTGFASAYAAYQSINLIKWAELTYARDEEGIINIEGFDPRPVTKANNTINFGESRNNGTIAKPLEIMLTLPDKSVKCKVSSNFDKNIDAFLSTSATSNALITGSNVASQTLPGFLGHGQRFYLHVFRTGPGDESFERKIYIDAYPPEATDDQIANGSVKSLERQTITVRINTNCDLEDVYLRPDKFRQSNADNAMVCVADRNKQSKPRIVNGVFQKCYSFHDAGYAIGGCPVPGNDISYYCIVVACQWCWQHIRPISEDGNRVRDNAEIQSPWYTDAHINRWQGCLPEWEYAWGNPVQSTSAGTDLTTNHGRATNTRIRCCFENNTFCSKGRFVIISDLKKKNGKYVACYIPKGPGYLEQFMPNQWPCRGIISNPGWGGKMSVNCGQYRIDYRPAEGIYYDCRLFYQSTAGIHHQEEFGGNRPWRTITWVEWNAKSSYTNQFQDPKTIR